MDEATRISLKDQFNSLLVRAIEGRRGGMALMRVLEELDFYNSPASAKHLWPIRQTWSSGTEQGQSSGSRGRSCTRILKILRL